MSVRSGVRRTVGYVETFPGDPGVGAEVRLGAGISINVTVGRFKLVGVAGHRVGQSRPGFAKIRRTKGRFRLREELIQTNQQYGVLYKATGIEGGGGHLHGLPLRGQALQAAEKRGEEEEFVGHTVFVLRRIVNLQRKIGF